MKYISPEVFGSGICFKQHFIVWVNPAPQARVDIEQTELDIWVPASVFDEFSTITGASVHAVSLKLKSVFGLYDLLFHCWSKYSDKAINNTLQPWIVL